MVNRRKFIQTIAAGTTAAIVSNPLLAFNAISNRKLKKFGYIEGIIGKELEGDWQSALSETVKYGYSEIEIGRFLGHSASSFLTVCNDIGIKPIAGGTVFTKNMDDVHKSLDELNALDLKYAVVYWPWLVGGPFKLEDCKISTDILNQIGEACKKKGLILCWHNHDKEFTEMEEGLPFDFLMKYTDKDLVKCELDIYWVKKGGADPVETLRRNKGRFAILHVKDMAPGEKQDFACPGSGIIDFQSVFSEATDQGINHYFVERDNVINGMECLKSSSDYLRNLTF